MSEKPVENDSFCNIYRVKCYNYLESVTFGEFISKIFLGMIAGLITLISAFPETGITVLEKIFMFQNMLFPKGFVIFYILYNYKNYRLPNISKTIKKMKFNFPKKSDTSKTEDLISGIPIVEILDHLFTNKHFKRTEIEKKFSISRNKYQELAEKMEEIFILKRGENNSRILNEDFSREQIARAFIYAEGEAKNLYMPVQETESGGFTRTPLLPSLREKITTSSLHETTA